MFRELRSSIKNIYNRINNKKKVKYISYCRVSQGDNYERQEFVIENYCENHGITIFNNFYESCSGIKSLKLRDVLLNKLFFQCVEGGNIVIIMTSVDRLSRSLEVSKQIIKLFSATDAKFFFIKEKLLVNPKTNNGVDDFYNLSKFSQYEVDNIINRMTEGRKMYIENCRKNNIKMGRPNTYRKSEETYKTQYSKDIELLYDGCSLRHIYAITGTSVITLRKLRNMFNIPMYYGSKNNEKNSYNK